MESVTDGPSTAPHSEAFAFTAGLSGTGASMTAYLTSTDGVHLALYSDSSGRPGSVLDQGQVASNSAGWTTVPLSGQVQLTASTRYWIVIGAVTGGTITYRDAGTSGSNLDFASSSFASPYQANGGQWNSAPLSAFVSGTTGGVVVTTTTTTAPPRTTTTTAPPQTTTTTAPTPTTSTTQPSGGSSSTTVSGTPGTCTNPVYSSSSASFNWYQPGQHAAYVNNDAWNGSHGPQTMYICNMSSWYVESTQPNLGGAVMSYPSVCDCSMPSQPMSAYHTLTSTFAETNAYQGEWDSGYDNYTNQNEIMIQPDSNNHGNGLQQGGTPVTIDGVPWHVTAGGHGFICFVADSFVKSGTINFLHFYSWIVSQGWDTWSDTLDTFAFGTEISWTVGQQRFDNTGFSLTYS